MIKLVFLILTLSCVVFAKKQSPNEFQDSYPFQIGAGIYDITGPAAETGMMGYATMSQISNGIHFRLRARSFVFIEKQSNQRIVFVNVDGAMVFSGVKLAVIAKLKEKFGALYDEKNVMISGTHTHSGPAGFAFYPLYNIMSLGFIKDNFNVIVNGIFESIVMAHQNVKDNSRILFDHDVLLDSNINRSPTAYLLNPESERNQYLWNVDKNFTLIKMETQNGTQIGSINWFSVHGTSMNNTNGLISGDNKGYAEYLFEKKMNGGLPGIGPFVAAFAQSNEGDVSPNTKGAHCPDGTPCDNVNSICPSGKTSDCIASGPGVDMFDSTRIIGENQFNMAWKLFQSASQPILGPIEYVHTYVDMKKVNVSSKFTSTKQNERTCHGSLGDSFAAGTTDGCGDFDFKQGTNSSKENPYWNWLSYFIISNPTKEEIQCQAPKPILLNVGDIQFPCQWAADIVSLQMFRIGSFFIVGVPGEFTTMAGRRLRNTIKEALVEGDPSLQNATVVIAGLSNEYTHYITTFEEYQQQRYEGASTLFGPHTLAAYQQYYYDLAYALAIKNSSMIPPGKPPKDLSQCTFDFQPPVIVDTGNFGQLSKDVSKSYNLNDLVTVIFYGANPRNNYRTQDTFLTVEKYDSGSNKWDVVLNDGDWDTKYSWKRHGIAESRITINWNISSDTSAGTYRIRHFGDSKNILGKITPYSGSSSNFTVVSNKIKF